MRSANQISHIPLADWLASVLQMPNDPTWRVDEYGYNPEHEGAVESRLTVSNGFLGVRGSLEHPAAASRPHTYIVGSSAPSRGGFPVPELIFGPDWLRMRMFVEGDLVTVDHSETPILERTLDMRRGAVCVIWRLRTPSGCTVTVRTLRFVSVVERALAAQLAQIEVDLPVALMLEAWLEPQSNLLEVITSNPEHSIYRVPKTGTCLAVSHQIDLSLAEKLRPSVRGNTGFHRWIWHSEPQQPAILTRLVTMAHAASQNDAFLVADSVSRSSFQIPALFDAHTQAWSDHWAASDLVVEGDERMQRALRFASYHLISAANPRSPHLSIGARARTGDHSRDHVFWNTEMYVLPFFTYTWPETARTMLLACWRMLPDARANALRHGLRGALYASSLDAEQQPPPIHLTRSKFNTRPDGADKLHTSGDVAYAIWQYWRVTGDDAFLLGAGAEIMMETARFWANRGELEADGQYHIRRVAGPDGYHERIDDNAYTNMLARWNIERGLEITHLLRMRWPDRWNELQATLDITDEELALWQHVATFLATGFDPDTRLFEQFIGYHDLEPIDLADHSSRPGSINAVLGTEQAQRTQVIKQADVVMLQALLWEQLPMDVHRANFDYYASRCDHGDPTSPAIHALLAARLGDAERAERYLQQAIAIDLDDTLGDVSDGIHIAAQGALWQAVVFGFGGLRVGQHGLRCVPCLPSSWRSLKFSLQWHARHVSVELRQAPMTVAVRLESGQPMSFRVGDLSHVLQPEKVWVCHWDEAGRGWSEAAVAP